MLVALVVVLYTLLLSPLLKLLRLGAIISHEGASKIIGEHFPEIKDKLLNTLQLQGQLSLEGVGNDLLLASIERRTEELRPVPFVNAIDLKSNLVYLKYSSIPLAIIACVLLLKPGVISEPAERIIQHRSAFVQPAPFGFEVVSSPLACPKGGSFEF